MHRNVKKAVLVALTAVIAGAGVYFLMPREPRYEGRSLSAWLADLDLESPKSQEKPAQAVRAIGTNALPWLRKMLVSKSPIWERTSVAVNANQSLIQFSVTPDNVVRNRALRGYSALGHQAKCDVPQLIELMESESSPQVRSYIALALGNIGPAAAEAIPVLERATLDKNEEVHKNAVSALANIKMWTPDGGPMFRRSGEF